MFHVGRNPSKKKGTISVTVLSLCIVSHIVIGLDCESQSLSFCFVSIEIKLHCVHNEISTCSCGPYLLLFVCACVFCIYMLIDLYPIRTMHVFLNTDIVILYRRLTNKLRSLLLYVFICHFYSLFQESVIIFSVQRSVCELFCLPTLPYMYDQW